MKKIILFLVTLALAVALSVARAEPQSVVLTPTNWQDVFSKLDPSRFGITGTYPLSPTTAFAVAGTSQCSLAIVFANGTVTVSGASGSSATLSRGLYIIAGYNDGVKWYAYIYNIDGWLATLDLPTTTGSVTFDKKVYGKIIYSGSPNQVIDTAVKVLKDWRGESGGGRTAWLVFNVSGNHPVSYTIREGTATIQLAYGGGPPIYMLYVGWTLPLNVTGTGLNQLFYAGAYLIVGSNWFRANYSAAPSQPSQNQTGANTATLTVTVTPNTYTIQFLSAGALVKAANGSLSHTFPKNTTVTVRILYGSTEKYKFDVKMDSDKYFSFNFGTDNSIYDPSKTYTLTLYFFEMSPSGAYRGQIVVDSVQVIGINASVVRSAQGVSNVRFTNLPAGHYQITVRKEGYFETRLWVNLDSDKTLYVGLFKKADTGGTDKPYTGGYVAPSNTTQPFSTIGGARNETPPAPTTSGNFYGFHFILIDPATGRRTSGTVTVSAVKRVGKVLWEDTVTVPLATVNVVNGSAWWYITEDDVFKAIQISGFWEGFGGFKITSGSNTMFVPAEMARNRFFEMVIYYGQAAFGTSNVAYSSGLYDSGGMLAQLMPILIIAMIIGMIGQVLKRK
ncbi:MAG: hypothetical protein LM576_01755 [Thermofilum sp.]|nr:hypothetical protein [Thermofilum sp.]